MKNFDFVGFEPSTQLKEQAGMQLRRLFKHVAGVVAHDAYIVKTKAGLFEGSIKIHTAWNTFSSSTASSSAEAIIHSLVSHIKKQIANWRRSRIPILPFHRLKTNRFDKEEIAC